MIFEGCRRGWPVIDATSSIDIIHQNHDFSHLPGGKSDYEGAEKNHNIASGLAYSGKYFFYLLSDTNRELRNGKITRPKITLPRLLRKIEVQLAAVEQTGWRWELTRRLKRIRTSIEKNA